MATLLQITGFLLFLVLWGAAWRKQPNLVFGKRQVGESPFKSANSYEKLRRPGLAEGRRFLRSRVLSGHEFGARQCSIIEPEPDLCFGTHLTATLMPQAGAMPPFAPANH